MDNSREDNFSSMADRSNGVCLREKYIPAPYLFDDAYYSGDPILFGADPWFDREMLGNTLLLGRYTVDGWLPGGVPTNAFQSWCWRYALAETRICTAMTRPLRTWDEVGSPFPRWMD